MNLSLLRAAASSGKNSILPLQVEDVCYSASGTQLLHHLTFTLAAGRQTILLGPNGAGKSLTLRLCHGLIQPSAGSILWRGTRAAEAGRHQAMVFQHPVMLRRSARANIEYALGLKGVGRRLRRRRASLALKRAGLAHLGLRPARALSIGQQQRLALARAWALEPEVLFLDEPTASLDPAATRAVEEIITAIAASGTKIVMTTHDLAQARRLADEVLFIHEGRIVEQAPAASFFAAPHHPAARAFLAGRLLMRERG
ncbi:MAG: ATP-binding cassette domain-containing protein [Acidobacteriota bacterium]